MTIFRNMKCSKTKKRKFPWMVYKLVGIFISEFVFVYIHAFTYLNIL